MPCPRPDLVIGIATHADATLISVLMVDDTVGGLQVLKDDVWYDVPASTDPHGLLIMVGDFAEVLFSSYSRFLFPFALVTHLNLLFSHNH
jgi:isopenicillin N synthase-like dioxygenase